MSQTGLLIVLKMLTYQKMKPAPLHVTMVSIQLLPTKQCVRQDQLTREECGLRGIMRVMVRFVIIKYCPYCCNVLAWTRTRIQTRNCWPGMGGSGIGTGPECAASGLEIGAEPTKTNVTYMLIRAALLSVYSPTHEW